MEVGQVCLKIAGRDAGKKCVVLNVEKNFALIDGETRRRKVNLLHIFPTNEIVKIKKDASHDEVVKVLGIEEEVSKFKKETKQKTVKPKHVKLKKSKPTGTGKQVDQKNKEEKQVKEQKQASVKEEKKEGKADKKTAQKK